MRRLNITHHLLNPKKLTSQSMCSKGTKRKQKPQASEVLPLNVDSLKINVTGVSRQDFNN